MHQLGALARSPLGKVGLLDKQSPVPAAGGIDRYAQSGGPATDHHDVCGISRFGQSGKHFIAIHNRYMFCFETKVAYLYFTSKFGLHFSRNFRTFVKRLKQNRTNYAK
jgi:hypothetical protein